MKKLFCSLLIVLSTALTAQSQTPAITMTTTTAVGSTFSINIGATASSTPIQVDWGNGTLVDYTIGTTTSTLSSTLGGSTVKVYGVGISYLDVSSKNLTALNVSEATALTTLRCYSNQLTALDVSNNTALTTLYCHSNQLTALDVSKNTALDWFNCSSNQLNALDVSKNTTLIKFDCHSNKLSVLDISSNTMLLELYCGSNHLTTLDISNNIGLITFSCDSNQLTALDVSNNTALTVLWCYSNQLTALDVTNNTALTALWCYSNQITALDMSNNTVLTRLECYYNQLSFGTLPIKLTTWTTYNYSPQRNLKLPKTKYSVNEIIDLSSQLSAEGNTTAYVWKTAGGATLVKGVDYTEVNGQFTFPVVQGDYLYCQMTNASFPDLTITTENISIPSTEPAITLTTSSAIGNTLSFVIAATSNSTPIQVDWGNGTLVDYTIGTSTSAISETLGNSTVKVYGVGISYLDVSSNNLKTLDISRVVALKTLICHSNQISTLNVTKNTVLAEFSCYSNQLTTLDLSNNILLTHLFCHNNQLTTLDVSKNTALTYFSCTTNKLNTLDVSKNSAITDLWCYENQLTTLDVSKNTALTNLWCNNNKLSTLDISRNIALTRLLCSSNLLIALDVSNNMAISHLECYSNQLTISTLPIKQPMWTIYNYSPQTLLKLPKNSYTSSEAIDLNSQLTANGNTTAYTWKTKGGATLASGVDYTANNGVFTFLKAQTDSVYCQMTNTTFPELTLSTSNVKITQFPSSIEEINLSGKIYPNPVRDLLHVECEESISRVEVFTVYGAKAYEQAGNGTSTLILPTTSLHKGLLIVKVFGRNGVMERKIVKE